MKSEKKIWFAILGLFFLVSGCQEDKSNGDYSTVSELIADRNRTRLAKKSGTYPKQDTSSEKEAAGRLLTEKNDAQAKKEALSSIILYEENVRIVGSESGRTLAKGTAYINKQGQIVRIKISKNSN